MAELYPGRVDVNTVVTKHDFSGSEPVSTTDGPSHSDGTRLPHNRLQAMMFNQFELEIQDIVDTIGDVETGFELAEDSTYRVTIGEKIRDMKTSLDNIQISNLSASYLYRLFGLGIIKGYRGEFELSVKDGANLLLSLAGGTAILPNAVIDISSSVNVADANTSLSLIADVGTKYVGFTTGSELTNLKNGEVPDNNYEVYALTNDPSPPSNGRGYVTVSDGTATIYLGQPAVVKNGITVADGWSPYATVLIYNTSNSYFVSDTDTAITLTDDNLKNGIIEITIGAGTNFEEGDEIQIMYKYHLQRTDLVRIYQDDSDENNITVNFAVQQGASEYDPIDEIVYPSYIREITKTLPLWYVNIDPVAGWYANGTTSSIQLTNSMLIDARQFIAELDTYDGNKIPSNSIALADNLGDKRPLLIDEVTDVTNVTAFNNISDEIDSVTIQIDSLSTTAHEGNISKFGTIVIDDGVSADSSFSNASSKSEDGKSYPIKLKYEPVTSGLTVAAHTMVITYVDDAGTSTSLTIYIPSFDTIDDDMYFYVAKDGTTYTDRTYTHIGRASESTQYLSTKQTTTRGSGIKQDHIQNWAINDSKIGSDIEISTLAYTVDTVFYSNAKYDDNTIIATIPESDSSPNQATAVEVINKNTYKLKSATSVSGKNINIYFLKNIPGAIYGTLLFEDIESALGRSKTISHELSGIKYGVYLQMVECGTSSLDTGDWHDNMAWISAKSPNSVTISITNSDAILLPMVEYVLIPEEYIVGEHDGTYYVDGTNSLTAGTHTITHNFGTSEHVALFTYTSEPVVNEAVPCGITRGATADTVVVPVTAEYFILKL